MSSYFGRSPFDPIKHLVRNTKLHLEAQHRLFPDPLVDPMQDLDDFTAACNALAQFNASQARRMLFEGLGHRIGHRPPTETQRAVLARLDKELLAYSDNLMHRRKPDFPLEPGIVSAIASTLKAVARSEAIQQTSSAASGSPDELSSLSFASPEGRRLLYRAIGLDKPTALDIEKSFTARSQIPENADYQRAIELLGVNEHAGNMLPSDVLDIEVGIPRAWIMYEDQGEFMRDIHWFRWRLAVGDIDENVRLIAKDDTLGWTQPGISDSELLDRVNKSFKFAEFEDVGYCVTIDDGNRYGADESRRIAAFAKAVGKDGILSYDDFPMFFYAMSPSPETLKSAERFINIPGSPTSDHAGQPISDRREFHVPVIVSLTRLKELSCRILGQETKRLGTLSQWLDSASDEPRQPHDTHEDSIDLDDIYDFQVAVPTQPAESLAGGKLKIVAEGSCRTEDGSVTVNPGFVGVRASLSTFSVEDQVRLADRARALQTILSHRDSAPQSPHALEGWSTGSAWSGYQLHYAAPPRDTSTAATNDQTTKPSPLGRQLG